MRAGGRAAGARSRVVPPASWRGPALSLVPKQRQHRQQRQQQQQQQRASKTRARLGGPRRAAAALALGRRRRLLLLGLFLQTINVGGKLVGVSCHALGAQQLSPLWPPPAGVGEGRKAGRFTQRRTAALAASGRCVAPVRPVAGAGAATPPARSLLLGGAPPSHCNPAPSKQAVSPAAARFLLLGRLPPLPTTITAPKPDGQQGAPAPPCQPGALPQLMPTYCRRSGTKRPPTFSFLAACLPVPPRPNPARAQSGGERRQKRCTRLLLLGRLPLLLGRRALAPRLLLGLLVRLLRLLGRA